MTASAQREDELVAVMVREWRRKLLQEARFLELRANRRLDEERRDAWLAVSTRLRRAADALLDPGIEETPSIRARLEGLLAKVDEALSDSVGLAKTVPQPGGRR